MKKRITAGTIVLCLFVSLFSVTAFAETSLYDLQFDGFSTRVYDPNFYPWAVTGLDGEQVLMTTNQGVDSSASILEIFFEEAGTFTFEFKTSTQEKSDLLYYSKNDVVTDAGSASKAINYVPKDNTWKADYSGEHDWSQIRLDVEEYDRVYLTYWKNGSISEGDDTIWVRNLQLVNDATTTVTVDEVGTGSGTVSGGGTVAFNSEVTLQATADEGSVFIGWVEDAGNDKWTIVSDETSFTFTAEEDVSYNALFLPGTQGTVARLGAGLFDNIQTALDTAAAWIEDGVVVLNEDHELTENITVPAGVTLLVPCDAEEVSYKAEPEFVKGKPVAPSAYRTLTVAEGAIITVNGDMEVGGKHNSASSESIGSVTGTYGYVVLEDTSRIIVKDGATLYAWGFISGEGKVRAEDGAEVYELFQIADWRGGQNLLKLAGAKLAKEFGFEGQLNGMVVENEETQNSRVFVFSQYYIQNIEAPLIMESGATETVITTFNIISFDATVAFTFIGEGGMFVLDDGATITKAYDAENDRLKVTTHGDSTIGGLVIDFSTSESLMDAVEAFSPQMATVFTMLKMDSRIFVLPLNDMDIVIDNGTVTVGQDISVLPGTSLTVNEGASLIVDDDTEVYLYSAADWNGCGFVFGSKDFRPVNYMPSRTSARTASSLVDAVLEVNGTLDVNGSLFSTAGVISDKATGELLDAQRDQKSYAAVRATGSGVLNYNNTEVAETYTQQVNHAIEWINIKIVSAKLENGEVAVNAGNDQYLDSEPGETYTYAPAVGLWAGKPETAATVQIEILVKDSSVTLTENAETVETAAEDSGYQLGELAVDENGNASFTVTSPKACIVIIETDNGGVKSYEKVPYTANVAANTYSFEAHLTEGQKVLVALKGDVSKDGKVNATDARQVQGYANKKTTFDDLRVMIGDVSGDDKVNGSDARIIVGIGNNKTNAKW